MLRVAIDYRDARIARTGVRTWVEGFTSGLDQLDDVSVRRIEPIWVPDGRSATGKVLGHITYLLWKQLFLPLRALISRCDVLICPDYVVPIFLARRSVPVFHDVSFWIHPQHYNPLWRALFLTQAEAGARTALTILTVSNFSRREIERVLGISSGRVIVAPLAPKLAALAAPDRPQCRSILKSYGIPTQYLLHVGVLERRKNLPRLVNAFGAAMDRLPPGIALVLAGPSGPKRDLDDSEAVRDTIRSAGLKDRVILTGHVPDAHLGALYRCASGYVFPSLREGFGIPLVEAMHWGVPIAASTSGALPEVIGDAGIAFDPQSTEDIEEALVSLFDPERRARLVARGRARVEQFTWNRSARRAVCQINQALGRSDDSEPDQ